LPKGKARKEKGNTLGTEEKAVKKDFCKNAPF
jgi:hypothetical protein